MTGESPLTSLASLALAALLGGCTSTRAAGDDQPTGLVSSEVDSTPIAAEEGSGLPASTLMPLEAGNSWTYEVDGTDDGCTDGTFTQRVLREEAVVGRAAFALSDFCGRAAEIVLASSPSQLLQYENGAWRTALASPLVDGRSWDYTHLVSYHWVKIGWAKTRAGLFADCWERQASDDESLSQVFCDSIGMVSTSASNTRIELTAFNLQHGELRSRGR